MGVMQCDRNYCENILCEHHSNDYGYLCNECFQELINSELSIDEFIQTRKKSLRKDYESREEYIRSQFS